MQNNFPPNYPEEYKIWFVEFLQKKFFVNPSVLIPRLETEVLIKRVRKFLQNSNTPKIIVDIGSGSGIIGISLADLANEIYFIDISADALEVAKKNFYHNFADKEASFVISDLLENLNLDNKKELIFVSNLPYIKNNDWQNMSEDTIFEPKLALFGGEKTGFELYEKLFFQLKEKNFSGKIFIEFGFDQKEIAKNFLEKNFKQWKTEFFSDYAGITRFAEIDLKNFSK